LLGLAVLPDLGEGRPAEDVEVHPHSRRKPFGQVAAVFQRRVAGRAAAHPLDVGLAQLLPPLGLRRRHRRVLVGRRRLARRAVAAREKQGGAPPPHAGSIGASTTVMLSFPPASLAAVTSRSAARSRSVSPLTMRRMSSSGIMPDRPSEHRMKQSPRRGCSGWMATCTEAFMPSARTITFLCGQAVASSAVMRFILM